MVRRWRNMVFFHSNTFLRPWPCLHAAFTAVKAAAVDAVVYYYRTIDISVMYNGPVYPYNGGVVAKAVAFPAAAIVTMTGIAIAIINAAIKAYMRPPVTGVKSVTAANIAPIGGSPVQSRIRRSNPNARYPIIAVDIIPGPVARLPYITVARGFRHVINPQRGRRRAYSNTYANLRICFRYGYAYQA